MISNARNRAFVWSAGLRVGLSAFRREPILGLKRLALPVSYWRTAEFAYAWQRLSLVPAARVLDVGSPKDLAVILARHKGYQITATDILPEAIALSERYVEAQGLCGSGPGLVAHEIQDGRSLTFSDNSFDAAYAVSVVEHIPAEGDTEAIRELVRVVKPGGVVVVTAPFDVTYRETFVGHSVYERKQVGADPVFFERHYDRTTLQTRLLEPSGAILEDVQYWGEGTVRTERILHRLGAVGTLLSPLEPALSMAFLDRIASGSGRNPMATFFTLRKPPMLSDPPDRRQ